MPFGVAESAAIYTWKIPSGLDDTFIKDSADKIVFLEMLMNKEMLQQGTSAISKSMETSLERNFFEMSFPHEDGPL